MKNKFVNIALIFLFAIALYQTYILWFVNLSNNTNSQNQIVVDSNIKEDLIKPFRLSVEIEENKFNSFYNVTDLTLYDESKKLFKTILKNGTIIDTFDENNYTDLVVFNYNFTFEGEYFKECLDENKSRVNLNSFDNIFVYFCKEANYANFYNSVEGTSTYVTFSDKSYVTTLNSYKKNKEYYFTSTDLIHFTEKWDNKLTFEEVTYTNPYSLNGEIHISSIESMIDNFFQNPLSKSQSIQNETNAITFSDNNTIIRYFPNNIFEYKYYYVYDDNAKNSFVEAYTLANNFIKNDIAVQNDFYLDSYDLEEEQIVFYFNYTIGNFPILLTENYKSEANINSFIEVTVKNNVVTNYKKIPYNFELTNTVNGNLTYESVVTGLDKPTNNLLAYKMDNTLPISLYWFLYYDDSEFTMPFSYN